MEHGEQGTGAKAKAAQENLDYEVSQNDALHEEKGQLLRECEAAKQARAEAEARAKDAENQLAGARQVAQAAKLRGDKLKAENDALKRSAHHRGGGRGRGGPPGRRKSVPDGGRYDRRAAGKLDAVTGDAEQDVRNAYDSVLLASRAMLNAWQMVKRSSASCRRSSAKPLLTRSSTPSAAFKGR